MLNKVVIMGRLTRDPEVRKVNNDVSVCSFSVACDRDIVSKGSNERETDFFDVTAWRSTADFVGKYFAKGRMIVVVGRLQKRNYTDKDGNKRSVVDIIAENVYFGDSKKATPPLRLMEIMLLLITLLILATKTMEICPSNG